MVIRSVPYAVSLILGRTEWQGLTTLFGLKQSGSIRMVEPQCKTIRIVLTYNVFQILVPLLAPCSTYIAGATFSLNPQIIRIFEAIFLFLQNISWNQGWMDFSFSLFFLA